jgi:hypothetical protein
MVLTADEALIQEGYQNLRRAANDQVLVAILRRDDRNHEYFLQYGESGVMRALLQYGRSHGLTLPNPLPEIEPDDDGEEWEGETAINRAHRLREAVRYARMAATDLFIAEDEPSTADEEEEDPEEEEVEPEDHPAAENQEQPVEDEWLCPSCENSPCEFLQAQEELERVVSIMAPETSEKSKRFHTYQFMSRRLHGQLGRNNRRALPPCCVQGIADLFPAEDGVYVGFREANA